MTHYGPPTEEEIEYEEAIGNLQATNAALLKALEATVPYLPSCPRDKGDDCGPMSPYSPRCAYMRARVAIEEAGGTA